MSNKTINDPWSDTVSPLFMFWSNRLITNQDMIMVTMACNLAIIIRSFNYQCCNMRESHTNIAVWTKHSPTPGVLTPRPPSSCCMPYQGLCPWIPAQLLWTLCIAFVATYSLHFYVIYCLCRLFNLLTSVVFLFDY